MCDRNQNGGEINPHIDLSELSLEDCKQIFKPHFIQQLNTMYMCGNLGDPIIANDTLEIFRYFRQHNNEIWLSMNTNAGASNSQWWSDLASVFGKNGCVIFSIDGLEDTNHLYRQGVNWVSVENSFTSFIKAGGRARWDFLIFEHNQHQVEVAKELATRLGFEKFVAKKTGRFITHKNEKKDSHQAVNRHGEKTTKLNKPSENYQNLAIKKQEELITKYGTMDDYLDQTRIVCKVKEEGSLFVTAEGLALPCCWTAGRMYKWWYKDPTVEQIWTIINNVGGKDAINAKKKDLAEVFESKIFEIIEDSWHKPSCASGKLKVCATKCGAEFDPFKEQFTQ
jgi:MoaA/NifB/PqqE/SkfB family radical SAM enzyme